MQSKSQVSGIATTAIEYGRSQLPRFQVHFVRGSAIFIFLIVLIWF